MNLLTLGADRIAFAVKAFMVLADHVGDIQPRNGFRQPPAEFGVLADQRPPLRTVAPAWTRPGLWHKDLADVV